MDYDSDDERWRAIDPSDFAARLHSGIDTNGRSLRAQAGWLGPLTANRLGGGNTRPSHAAGDVETQTRRSRGSGDSTTGSGQPFAEVLPAVGTQLPIDGYPLDARLVAHELARRARLVLDFEDHLVAGTLLGEFLATHRTGVHRVSHGGNNT